MLSQEEINTLLSDKTPPRPSGEGGGCTPHLYHWHIEKITYPYNGKEYTIAYGIVTGHKRLTDTTFIHTSPIQHIEVDTDAGQVRIQTKNTEYLCCLSDCAFSNPCTYEFIPGLSEYALKYEEKKEYEQDDNTILMVLSDHESYYFKTMLIKKDGILYKGEMYPHIGTFQDSCLVSCRKCDRSIDIRYFPHCQHLETYCWEASGLPVYLENEGDGEIFFQTDEGLIELKPGQRKLVSKENTIPKDAAPILDQGDLYPPGILSCLIPI